MVCKMSASKCFCGILFLILIFHNVSSLDPYTVIQKPNASPILDARRGSTFEIRCDVNNRPDGKSTHWEREGDNCTEGLTCRTLIAQDRLPIDQQKYGLKFQPSDTYFLIIKNIDERDEGHYYCLIYVTLYVRVTDSVYLRVVEPPSIDPLKTSSDKDVVIGDDVELTCAAYGRPKPLIKWTRAGNGMMPGGGYVKLTEKLVINNIQPQYRGQYICTASSGDDEDHRVINVNMNFPPVVTANPSVVSQKLGYETRLFCHVSSQPKAESVVWFVGDNLIDEQDSKYRVTNYESAFSNLISKLTIYSVSSTEINSNIRCVATNVLGTGETTVTVEAAVDVQRIPGASSSSNRLYVTFSLLTLTALVLLS